MTKEKLHKLAILGTPRCGKTTFCVRLARQIFSENIPTTRGIDFHVVTADLEGLKLQIWDLAGQSHFRDAGVFDGMVAGATAFLFCYDASDPSSIREVDDWLAIAQQHGNFDRTKKYLVGLKGDLVSDSSIMALHELVKKHINSAIIENHFIISTKTEMNLDSFISLLGDDLRSFSDEN